MTAGSILHIPRSNLFLVITPWPRIHGEVEVSRSEHGHKSIFQARKTLTMTMNTWRACCLCGDVALALSGSSRLHSGAPMPLHLLTRVLPMIPGTTGPCWLSVCPGMHRICLCPRRKATWNHFPFHVLLCFLCSSSGLNCLALMCGV